MDQGVDSGWIYVIEKEEHNAENCGIKLNFCQLFSFFVFNLYFTVDLIFGLYYLPVK